MKRFFSFLLFILLLAVAIISLQLWKERADAGYTLRRAWNHLLHGQNSAHYRPEKYTVATGPRVNVNDVDVLAAMSRQRVLLAKAVVPSVVSITTSKTVPLSSFGNDPLLQMFHRGLHPSGSTTQKSLGSGAIVSKEGHIVTNNHVIDQMDEIEVRLSDGRSLPATLIGADPLTDIAILKIDADDLLPLPFGDSEAVEVGETVMAVGNPYGLDESVSQGIISAKGRRGSENISDLFQTDAAINPGNSGGPLVNVRGELIGVNEAIISESGGWMGVGFAIPAATVRTTMDTILKTGRAIHGYLGILQPVNDDTVRPRALGDQKGVLVDRVTTGSPAEKAAILPGDIIQKFNHQPINDFQDLRRSVAEVDVNATVPIELLRDGKKLSVNAQIAERPPPGAQLSQMPPFQAPALPSEPSLHPGLRSPGLRPAPGADADSLPGVQVADLVPALARSMNLPREIQGVIVSEVEPGTAAAEKLQPGDVIEQIDQQAVVSVADFGKLVRALPRGLPVVLSVLRERTRILVVLTDG